MAMNSAVRCVPLTYVRAPVPAISVQCRPVLSPRVGFPWYLLVQAEAPLLVVDFGFCIRHFNFYHSVNN